MDVFGYGSLTGLGGRASTLSGFRPVWGVAMDNQADLPGYKYYVDARSGERLEAYVVFLDLTHDAGRQVPGVSFEVSIPDLERLDRRELNYRREPVTLDDGEPAWVYLGLERSRQRCVAALKSGTAVVDLNYYNAVREGFQRLGGDALATFERTADRPPCPLVDLRRVDLPAPT